PFKGSWLNPESSRFFRVFSNFFCLQRTVKTTVTDMIMHTWHHPKVSENPSDTFGAGKVRILNVFQRLLSECIAIIGGIISPKIIIN
ncbi:MAG: hypothetical protein MUF71_21110, partial [Candidatus Kapabacteria bacterium]|nr:hypothetical protein [Candidatus Kapabacteria bacterium]